MAQSIQDIPLHETTRERYLNYALSVITSRALPDVRDGLKPVQRRILYAMFHNLHLTPDSKYRKSAAVIGEVMAKYHPHGDQSIYDAMVRLAQDFSLRYPLIDGQGNFGSLDGDNAAAMRYTEAKLRHLAVELLSEIKKNTIDYRPNYDGTLDEPVVLPAQAPNLLINGATGIAVGMATAIPPHNLKEVVGACIALIDRPELGIEDLVGRHVRGPDFPTGGEILNDGESLREIYARGRGPIEMRGTYELEKEGRTRSIVITSIPYGLNKSSLITEMADHVRAGKVPQITDIRDESTEEVRIVLELRRGANPDAAMAYLYRRTRLQMRFNVNLTALCPTDEPGVCRPERLDLLRILRAFLDFRFEVTTRRLRYDLEQLLRRIHLLEGFEIIFDALDEAIALIRKSDGKGDARGRLMKRFGLDWEQAEAVLETKLYRLARLEIDAIRAELAEKRAEAARIGEILASNAEMWALVRSELKEIREAYGDRRRTLIKGPVEKKSFRDEDYIVREDAFVIVTRRGWFKRQKSYTDISAIRLPSDDEVGWVVPASSRQSLILFTDRGRAYTMRVADVPQTTGYGEAIQTRFDFRDGERVVGVSTSDPRILPRVPAERLAAVGEGEPKPPYLVALSRSGRCLRMSLEPFCDPSTRAGRLLMRLTPRFKGGDRVVSVQVSDGEELVSMVSHQSRALVFAVGEIHVLSRPGKGVMAMKLGAGDFVMGFKLVKEKMDGLQVQTNRGKTEIVRPNKYKPSARAGRGREIIKKGHIAEVKFEATEWRFPDEEPIDEPPAPPEEDKTFEAAFARATDEREEPATRATEPIPLRPPPTSLAAGATAVLRRHEAPAPGPIPGEPGVSQDTKQSPEPPPKQVPGVWQDHDLKDNTPADGDRPLEIMPLETLVAAAREPPATAPATDAEPLLVPPVPEPKSLPRSPSATHDKVDGWPDDDGRLPRLDRLAKMAAERFERRSNRKKKKPKEDPNQGSLF